MVTFLSSIENMALVVTVNKVEKSLCYDKIYTEIIGL